MKERLRLTSRTRRLFTVTTYFLQYFIFNLRIIIIFLTIFNVSLGLPLIKRNDDIFSMISPFLREFSNDNNIRSQRQDNTVIPPHCSKAIVTASQTSRLTRRSTSESLPQQMSLNIGVAQTICFRLEESVSTSTSSSSDESLESGGNIGSEENYALKKEPLQSSQTYNEQRPLSMTPKVNAGLPVMRRIVRPLRKNYAAPKNRRNADPNPIKNELRSSGSNMSFSFGVFNENYERRNNITGNTWEQNRRGPSSSRNPGDSQNFENLNNLLHTVTVVELEQYYAITQRYRFAIPEVETNCICECNPQAPTCQADEWKYGECGSSPTGKSYLESACHRTFFANQPSGGCPSGSGEPHSFESSSSRLCCQLRFRAHQNRVFTALKLEPSTTHAVLQYSVYEYLNNDENKTSKINNNGEMRQWIERHKRRINVQLDGVHNSMLDATTGLKISVHGLGSGSTSARLDAGMYYVENIEDGTFGEIRSQPLNSITEHDFHKLGWLRIVGGDGGIRNGEIVVQSGDIFLDRFHHAKTHNCAEQRFRSVLDASYYLNQNEQMNNSTTEFRLAEPLNVVHRWIRSARVLSTSSLRQAVVRAGEGVSLDVTLTPPNSINGRSQRRQASSNGRQFVSGHRHRHQKSSIIFVHNSSRIVDFNGVIFVDRYSSSFLNLTLYGARGALNGYVRQLTDWDGENIDTFSFTVPPQQQDITTIVERIKPYPINSVQMVCLRPDDGDLAAELCRPVHSIELELEMNTMRNEWSYRVGSCPECNKITVDGFMKYLNPLNWTKGINSVSEALMLASDILIYVFIFIILYFVIAKIIIPLAYCCLCPMHAFYNSGRSFASFALANHNKAKKKSKVKTKSGGSERSTATLTCAVTKASAVATKSKTPSTVNASRLTPKVRNKRITR